MMWSLCLVPVRILLSSMAVLYHVNDQLQKVFIMQLIATCCKQPAPYSQVLKWVHYVASYMCSPHLVDYRQVGV